MNNQRLKRFVMSTVSYFTLSITSVFPVFSQADNLVQVGRYVSIQTGPTQAEINPLDAIAAFRFPSSVKTVGEALSVVLANTGFRLADKRDLLEEAKATLNMSLPITNRKLGLMSIEQTITVLMGQNVYALQVNMLDRTINFRLTRAYQPKRVEKPRHRIIRKSVIKKRQPSKGDRYEFI